MKLILTGEPEAIKNPKGIGETNEKRNSDSRTENSN